MTPENEMPPVEVEDAGSTAHSLRLACLDLTRVTEQMAILASCAAGFDSTRVLKPAGLPEPSDSAERDESIHPNADLDEPSEPDDEPDSFIQQVKTLRSRMAKYFYWSLAASIGGRYVINSVDLLWTGHSEANVGEGLSLAKKGNSDVKAFKEFLVPDKDGSPKEHGAFASMYRTQASEFPPIHLIVKPICGMPDLYSGQFGVIAPIAGAIAEPGSPTPFPLAERATFKSGIQDQQTSQDRFLVITTGNERVAEIIRHTLAGEITDGAKLALDPKWRVTANLDYGSNDLTGVRVLKDLYKELAKLFVVTMDNPLLGPSQLIRGSPLRRLTGSEIAAGTAAMLPKLFSYDLFTGVIRSASLHMLAVNARCLGTSLFAIPINPIIQKKNWKVANDLFVLTEKDLVRSQKVFFVATGVSPHPLLRGVRIFRHESPSEAMENMERAKKAKSGFPDTPSVSEISSWADKLAESRICGRVSTHSVVLNGASATNRFIKHQRDLSRDHFCWQEDGTTRLTLANKAIMRMLADLRRPSEDVKPGRKATK